MWRAYSKENSLSSGRCVTLFDVTKSSLLPQTPNTILREIQENGSFRMQLFRSGIQGKSDTPYHYMLASQSMLWSYPEISDETLLIVLCAYQHYELKISVDRDFFELSIREKDLNYTTHLLHWQFASDWEGLSWVEFEACMVSWMAAGIKKLDTLLSGVETALDDGFGPGSTTIPEEA